MNILSIKNEARAFNLAVEDRPHLQIVVKCKDGPRNWDGFYSKIIVFFYFLFHLFRVY